MSIPIVADAATEESDGIVWMPPMQRKTFTLPDDLVVAFDRWCDEGVARNHSHLAQLALRRYFDELEGNTLATEAAKLEADRDAVRFDAGAFDGSPPKR
jgi:hypothetical protein